MQQQVAAWISKTPDGYWPREKMYEKMQEEINEMGVAASEYDQIKDEPDDCPQKQEKLKHLKIEIGDVLFAICCLANVDAINLEESYKKDIESKVATNIPKTFQDFMMCKNYGELIKGVCDVTNCYAIELSDAFTLTMQKNEERAKNNYQK